MSKIIDKIINLKGVSICGIKLAANAAAIEPNVFNMLYLYFVKSGTITEISHLIFSKLFKRTGEKANNANQTQLNMSTSKFPNTQRTIRIETVNIL